MSVHRRIVEALYRIAKRNALAKRLGRRCWPVVASLARSARRLAVPTQARPPIAGVVVSTPAWTRAQAGASCTTVDLPRQLKRADADTVEPQPHARLTPRLGGKTRETFVATIPDGVVAGDGCVVAPDGQVLGDLCCSPSMQRMACLDDVRPQSLQLPGRAERVRGRVAVLAFPFAGTNYYHWMLDSVTRLRLLQRLGIDLASIDGFYFSDVASGFHVETLQRLGVPTKKILTGRWRGEVVADELVVPSLVGDSGDFPDWVMRYQQQRWWPDRPAGRPRRLYLNRDRVTYRRVRNEGEIEQLLARYGFESVAMDDHSVAEQAAMMYDAEMVVGPHGAALANLMFCRPGTRVIELHNRRLVNNMYWSIAGEIDLDYAYLLSEPQPAATDCLENEADLSFDTAALEELLGRSPCVVTSRQKRI